MSLVPLKYAIASFFFADISLAWVLGKSFRPGKQYWAMGDTILGTAEDCFGFAIVAAMLAGVVHTANSVISHQYKTFSPIMFHYRAWPML